MFKPVTLRATIEQAKLHEKAIEDAQKKDMMMAKTSYQVGGSSSTKNTMGSNPIPTVTSELNRTLAVLIDSGSTHSFIDEQAVGDTGYVAEYSPHMKVTVADGDYVMCHTSSPGFSWKMEGKAFKEDLRIINLRGCDLVLGNDWIKKNNPIKFDHEKKFVTIGRKGNKTILHVIPGEGSLSMISGSAMGRLIKKGQTLMAHLFMLGVESYNEQEQVDATIQEVLDKYQFVFAEPKSLPPVKQLDHAINLKPRASPKDAFVWNEEADQSFAALKRAMPTTPVLALPSYDDEFVVETDACHSGIRAVLLQRGRAIAYFSKVLAMKHRDKSIHEKEYLALLNAVDKWRHYLQYKHFVVKTDHHSLKYLLEQKVTTTVQQRGLTKLLGLDYEVQYKKGAEEANTISK
ncbi:hypothetical protein KY285_000599 [Solanum tuberosum]|nr:hypothetical protein KY285_000599 [Solanum tuberosum]